MDKVKKIENSSKKVNIKINFFYFFLFKISWKFIVNFQSRLDATFFQTFRNKHFLPNLNYIFKNLKKIESFYF